MTVELNTKNNMVKFSAELSRKMKLKVHSPVMVFKIKGKDAYGFKKVDEKFIGEMQLGFAEGGRVKSIHSLAPTPILMLTTLGYIDEKKTLEVKEGTIENTGEKFYYIGETL